MHPIWNLSLIFLDNDKGVSNRNFASPEQIRMHFVIFSQKYSTLYITTGLINIQSFITYSKKYFSNKRILNKYKRSLDK